MTTAPVKRAPLPPDAARSWRVAAVLLAAGAGSRMGYRPKSLLELDGVPLIRRQVMALQGAGVTELVVVLGHHASQIAPLLDGLEVTLVTNPNPDASPISSQRLGLHSLSSHANAMLMALADQPLIDVQDLQQLIAAFQHRAVGKSLLFPRVQGQPGNPVMFTAAVRDAMLACPPDVGCKQWRQQQAAQVEAFDCDNLHFVQDLDTPEDLEKFRLISGRQLHWPSATLSSLRPWL
jgi:molybdenum cofactor cytidylyltransferase